MAQLNVADNSIVATDLPPSLSTPFYFASDRPPLPPQKDATSVEATFTSPVLIDGTS
jgi:hypothetical protein